MPLITLASGTLTQIPPVNLPDAAGYKYFGGDVLHQPPNSPIDWAGLQFTSRNLAARDNLLSEALNQVIAQVNNKEQLIPVNVPWTYLAPGDSVTTFSVRIPNGFEARVLNAAVDSSPVPNSCLLEVIYSANFGDLTGQAAVSTYTENSSATSFYPSGELAIKISNAGTQSISAVASVLITMQPVVDQAGALIGPGVIGEQGDPGQNGLDGADGGPGPVGPPGPPGINWRGVWSGLNNYAQNDAVYVNFGVLGIAAFIALVPNSNQQPPTPSLAPSAFWNILAYSPPSSQPIQVTPSWFYSGNAVLNQDFGYFLAPFTGQITGASVVVQTAPSGSVGVQVDVVSSADIRTFSTVYVAPGSFFSGTTFANPVNLNQGDYFRSRFTSTGNAVSGANVSITYVFVA